MLVLVVLVLVIIGAHGCELQYVGQPLEAASTATAAASAAAQRSMDRVRGSGLPLRASDVLPMAALCFSKISVFFYTRGKPKHAVGLVDWHCERNETARVTRVRLFFSVK